MWRPTEIMERSPGRLIAIGLTSVFLVAAGCGGGEPDNDNDPGGQVTQEIAVEAFDFYFEETSLLVDRNARVTVDLVNAGNATHSFTAPDIDVDIEAESGETTEFSFTAPDQPGIFNFFCKYHPGQMEGTISIGGEEEPIQEDVDVEDEDDDADGAPGGGPGYDY